MTNSVDCPLRLRFAASLIGGSIGAINPMLQSFDVSGHNSLEGLSFSAMGEHFAAATGFTAWFMILPCLLANFVVYPWLYRQIRERLNSTARPKLFRLGANFGIMATAVAVLFLAGEVTLMTALETSKQISILGCMRLFIASLFSFGLLALFYIPIMLFAGYLYTLANFYLIKKYYHPNIAKSV